MALARLKIYQLILRMLLEAKAKLRRLCRYIYNYSIFFLVRLFSVFVFIEFQSAMNIVLFISTDLHFFFLPSFCILI